MRVCSFLCSDSLVYFFLFLSILHGVYTRDCSYMVLRMRAIKSVYGFKGLIFDQLTHIVAHGALDEDLT